MKWSTLVHNGICLPPPYRSRGFTVRIRGKEVRLTSEQEEMAYAWAKKIGTPYVQDPVFATNFLKDFTKTLPPDYADLRIEEVDFSEILRHIEAEKIVSKEEKSRLSAERKALRTRLKEQFGYAWVDGEKIEVANWMVEPAGIFMGRGSHPLRGRWKPRVHQEDITLNLGEDVPSPSGSWGGIVHDHDSMWFAYWMDRLAEKRKYVWPSDGSSLRQMRDKEKYEGASRLEGKIERLRRLILKGMQSKDERERKLATVCFLIDRLAMRVGDEKEEDEADTIGATTLRVEHVKISDHEIGFDFLGKDSMRWQKTTQLNGTPEDEIILRNFSRFVEGKKLDELLFDGISSSAVNHFLSRGAEGLTTKAFRTYHATDVVKKYLREHAIADDTSLHLKIHYAKLANLAAAVTCNHKRTPPKNWDQSLAKKEETLKRLRSTEPKTPKQAERLRERVEKIRLTIELAKETKDYNLNTSLKNYIDPRVYKAWADYVGVDWRLLYTKSLLKKFSWVNRSRLPWTKL